MSVFNKKLLVMQKNQKKMTYNDEKKIYGKNINDTDDEVSI